MKLKILSWNIWYDGHFDIISKFLAEADADIIGIEEIVPNDLQRNIIGFLEKLGYHYIVAPVLTIKDGRIMSNAIFSKYPIISSETYLLSEEKSRNVLRAYIKIGDETLHVFCTHLLHTHQQPSEIQKLQIENLIKVLSKEKTILMGDFNATPESNTIGKISKVLVNTDSKQEPTWCVYKEGCSVCNLEKVSIRLDYIFASQDLKTDSSKVYQSKGSDHLPISVNIEI
jgi:endonuclease/exonuclease/phosphatase family metal-dependent hydrolase